MGRKYLRFQPNIGSPGTSVLLEIYPVPADMQFEKKGDARMTYVWDFARIGEGPVGYHTRICRNLSVPDPMIFISRLNLLRGRSRGDASWDPPIWVKR